MSLLAVICSLSCLILCLAKCPTLPYEVSKSVRFSKDFFLVHPRKKLKDTKTQGNNSKLKQKSLFSDIFGPKFKRVHFETLHSSLVKFSWYGNYPLDGGIWGWEKNCNFFWSQFDGLMSIARSRAESSLRRILAMPRKR